MSKKQSAGGAGRTTTPPVPQAAPAGAKTWPPAIKRRTFWLLALIPLAVLVAMSVRGVVRPFVGLHAWGQADSSVYARNHVRYGLGYTHGVMTMALGYPPPPDAKRYYDHPQYGGLVSAAVMWIFGINDWSVQLGFLLSDLVVMVLMMALLRRFVGGWQSLLSGLILAMMPISAYFGLGAYQVAMALGAFWMYLVIAGFMPDKQPRWWHYTVLGVLLFACVQMNWSGFFSAAAIGLHYSLTCIVRRQWPNRWLTAVIVFAPILSAVLVFTVMLSGFDWDYHRILDLYKWRAAAGERAGQGGFAWGAWFERAWEFGQTNFTVPILLVAAGYLVYLAFASIYRLSTPADRRTGREVLQPFPLAILLLLPGLLQMFVLKGALWPHQFWERPLNMFIATAAALGIVTLAKLIARWDRAFATLAIVVVVTLLGWKSVQGANYYYSFVWVAPQKLAMWKELNHLTPPDKELATFDRELDSLVVTQSASKGAVYRGEPAWYIDRMIVDANTPRQIEALAASGKATVYLLPVPGSLGYGKYGQEDGLILLKKHMAVLRYLLANYPVVTYAYSEGVPSMEDPDTGAPKFGMRPYLIFDLTKPGQPNFNPQKTPDYWLPRPPGR